MGSVNSGPGKEKKMPNRLLDENESAIAFLLDIFLDLLGMTVMVALIIAIGIGFSAFMSMWTPY